MIQTKYIADLQQYCYANERMSTFIERNEPTSAGKPHGTRCHQPTAFPAILSPFLRDSNISMLNKTDCCRRLQTAFHASFTDSATADKAVLQISRGTSIVSLQ